MFVSGRGATENPSGRFEPFERLAFADDWVRDQEEPSNVTEVRAESTRRIITRNESPAVPFDRSINPYRGCEHGCIYCYARTTHAYLGLSPGLDFEQKLTAKPEAALQLRRELSAPSYRCELIAIGTNTDAYQPAERRLRIMRSVLEVLFELRHPVSLVTKSALVLRDLDLLAPMARDGLACVRLSLTTLDPGLARVMEPRAATPKRRLEAIRALAEAGVPVGVLIAPIIPGLTDHELDALLAAAREAGATSADYALLRLPGEVQGLFEAWLAAHVPLKAGRVRSRLRECHDGVLYDPRFGVRDRGNGAYAAAIAARFALARRRLAFDASAPVLDTTRFAPPGQQLRLF